jgi:hypothetical protein
MLKKIINRCKMEWELFQLLESVAFLNMPQWKQEESIKQVKAKYGYNK